MVRSFNQHLVLIFILMIGLGNSFSLARRQVKEVINEVIITDEKQYTSAVGDSTISLEKESVDAITNAAEIETRGRKVISMETRIKKMRKEKKVSLMAASISSAKEVENNVLGKRKGDDHHDHIGVGDDKNWKDDFMAFSADYRSAKSHPPKNN